MSGMGRAIMGTGLGEGENRCIEAANRAVSNPLLEDVGVEGAHGVIVNVTGGSDLSMLDISEAVTIIRETAHEDANIIVGAVENPEMEGKVKITVIATGFGEVGASRSQAANANASTDTPIDLPSYRSWREEKQVAPLAVTAAGSRGNLGITRRPLIELPLSSERKMGNNEATEDPVEDRDLPESHEPEDVPAFLRRQAE